MLATLTLATVAEADPFTPEEAKALVGGGNVRRSIDVELSYGDYFGGLSYILVDGTPDAVIKAIADGATWKSIFPLTIEAKEIQRPPPKKKISPPLRYVTLTQGKKGVATATYTVIVRQESPNLVRYWLDATEPHDIADTWGSFRVQPYGKDRTLLTFSALVRLEEGFTKLFFSEKIRSYALDVPVLVQALFRSQRFAQPIAPRNPTG